MSDKFHSALSKWWGYNEFREGQLDVIRSVCDGRDTLALMPTGAGKSLLYQVPTMVQDGLCVVITPLVALMKDQVDRLRSMGILASAIHSGMTRRQIDLVLDNCAWGDTKFLYVAPERVQSEVFRVRFGTMNVSLIAIDEAHCISQWGYDFRPSYMRLGELRDIQPGVPILALTASATPLVVDDIMRCLKMKNGQKFTTTFARRNISFAMREVEDKRQHLLRIVNNVPGCGIVYVRTREQTVEIADYLKNNGYPSESYHGGMGHAERAMRQDSWKSGRCRIMVATNAFGMGIDKADVRFVVHYDICDSLEAYYQEAGRGGRDGKRAYAVLLTSSDDRGRAQKRFETEYPTMQKIKECYEQLYNYLRIEIGGGKHTSVSFNVFDFAGKARIYTGSVINAIKILQLNGYMTLTEEMDHPPRVMFIVGRDDLYKIRIEREELDNIIRTLLRLYSGIFNERMVPINEQEIAQSSGYTPEQVHDLLKRLWQLRIIRYIPGNRSPLLMLNEERLPTQDVYISPQSYEQRKRMAEERLEAMYRYGENNSVCRSRLIQEYFGEENVEDCGVCDLCIERRKRGEGSSVTIESKIENILIKQILTIKELVGQLSDNPKKVAEAVDKMVDSGKIMVDSDGKMRINR